MRLFFRKWVRFYKYSFFKKITEEEICEQGHLSSLFSLIGSIIAFLASMNAFFIKQYSLAVTLSLVGALLLLTFYTLKSPVFGRYQGFFRYNAIISLYVLCFYLIYGGGINNSGPLWIYITPSVAFAYLGLRKGIIANSIFGVAMSCMLFFPNDMLIQANYSYEFKTRLVYVFITIVGISCLYEAARHCSFIRLKAMKDKYEYQARFDYLTMLPNRRGIENILIREVGKNNSRNKISTIAMLDMDKFKVINDEFGHEVGDRVLKHASRVLSDCVRSQDTLARWGGEEFLLFLPGTREKEAMKILDSIRKCVEKSPFKYGDISIPITLSVGLCETSPDVDFNHTIKLSDISLYQAKQAGRNTVFAYTPELF